MRTGTKILIAYGLFALLNVSLGWLAFFLKGTTPDTLLTLVLGIGGVIDVMSAAVAIAGKLKGGTTDD